jgi:hypothetical protein
VVEIISRQEAAAIAGIHERTLDRLHTQGLGPLRIQLTRRRCGYDREAFERWLKSRAFSSQAAAVAAGATLAVPVTTLRRHRTPPAPQTLSRAEQKCPKAAKQRGAK